MRYGDMTFSEESGFALTEDRTINLLTSDTTAEKQAKIDAAPRIATGNYTVTFHFEDGTHTETDTLYFRGFSCPLTVRGNDSDSSSKNTSQSVIIDSTAVTSSHALHFDNCSALTYVRKLHIKPASSSNRSGIFARYCPALQVFYSYFFGNGMGGGSAGVRPNLSHASVRGCLFNNIQSAILAENTFMESRDNDDTGTSPQYGLQSNNGSTIGKYPGTQPAGSIASEYAVNGSVIRS